MRKQPRRHVTRSLLAASLLATALAITSCGGTTHRDRSAMCEAIFVERTTGIIKPFREAGPDHRAAFMQLCVTLPDEYLRCELEEASRQSSACAATLRQSAHRRRLNTVLVSGRDTPSATTDASKPPAAPTR